MWYLAYTDSIRDSDLTPGYVHGITFLTIVTSNLSHALNMIFISTFNFFFAIYLDPQLMEKLDLVQTQQLTSMWFRKLKRMLVIQ